MATEKPPQQSSSGAMRLASAGIELAGTIAVACLLGYWIDRKFGTEPWGLITLAGIGIVGGLYNLIRNAVHEMFQPGGKPPPHKNLGGEGNSSDNGS